MYRTLYKYDGVFRHVDSVQEHLGFDDTFSVAAVNYF